MFRTSFLILSMLNFLVIHKLKVSPHLKYFVTANLQVAFHTEFLHTSVSYLYIIHLHISHKY